jgi:hypothetical protein
MHAMPGGFTFVSVWCGVAGEKPGQGSAGYQMPRFSYKINNLKTRARGIYNVVFIFQKNIDRSAGS